MIDVANSRNTNIPVKTLSSYTEILNYVTEKKKFNRDSITSEFCDNESELVNKIAEENTIWFRGHSKIHYNLEPSLYRSGFNVSELKREQEASINNFRTLYLGLLRDEQTNPFFVEEEDKLYWLSILQHYGIFSPLLDWSQSLKVGIYFAIEYLYQISQQNEDFSSAIWLYKPVKFNNLMKEKISDSSFRTELTDTIHQDCQFEKQVPTQYEILRKDDYLRFPLNFQPMINTKRIRTQKGTFTYFPLEKLGDFYNLEPLDFMDDAHKFLEIIIIQDPEKCFHEINNDGFNPLEIYPSMANRIGLNFRNNQ